MEVGGPVAVEKISALRETLRGAFSKALRKNSTLVEDLVEALVGLDVAGSQMDVQRIEDQAISYIMDGVNGNREMISYLSSAAAEHGADVQSFMRDMVGMLTNKHDLSKATELVQKYILGMQPTMDTVAGFFQQLLVTDVKMRRDLVDRLFSEFKSIGIDFAAFKLAAGRVLNRVLQANETVVDQLLEIAFGDDDGEVVALLEENFEGLQSAMMKLSANDILTTRKFERDLRGVTTVTTRRR